MALNNYSDLISAVANELHRSDLDSVIPDKITLAEVRINGDLDARLQDTKTTLTCVANQDYVTAPTDMIGIRHLSVQVTPVVTLDYVTPDQFETSFPWGSTGIPQVFTIIGSKIYLAPIPDSAYVLTTVYKAKVPSLETNTTTWLMTNYPNVYFFATLLEMSPYIKDDARIPMWMEAYSRAIESVNKQDWYSGSMMRIRTDVR